MGLGLCCAWSESVPTESDEQAHTLIVSSTSKAEIDALVKVRRRSRSARTLPLLEVAHAPFELTSPEVSSDSPIQPSLLLEVADDARVSQNLRELALEDSEDEGGIAGELDSTDDD
jgi:hypothetical protein